MKNQKLLVNETSMACVQWCLYYIGFLGMIGIFVELFSKNNSVLENTDNNEVPLGCCW